jgi:TrmH family RNA methyltransferase
MFPRKATINLLKEVSKEVRNLKKNKLFLIEDIKTFEIAIERNLKPVNVFITEDLFKKIEFLFKNSPEIMDKTFLINNKELKKIQQLKTNMGMISLFRYRKEPKPSKESLPFHLFFDRVQDPGNMGTIIRSALSFNIRKVYLSTGTTSIYNPKLVRGSMGAVFSLPIEEKADFKKIFGKMRKEGKQILFTSSEIGKALNKTEIKAGSAIVFGNESKGISEGLEEFATGWIKIPTSGKTESLSVSIASSIIMSELFSRNLGN